MGDPALSYTALFVLQALGRGHPFGFDTSWTSPACRAARSTRRCGGSRRWGSCARDWEDEQRAHAKGRPRRRYYELSAAGKRRLTEAEARYRAVGRLFPRRSST